MHQKSLIYREECSRSSVLDAIWTLRVTQSYQQDLSYRTLPDGCMDLLYRQKRDRSGESESASLLIAGPTEHPASFIPLAGEEILGIRVAPGWGFVGLGVSPRELLGTFTDARGLSPRFARLEKDLFACESQDHASSVLVRTVHAWAEAAKGRPYALQAIQVLRQSRGKIRVREAAQQLGISARSLHRGVSEISGLSPKALTRIFRFRRALEAINASQPLPLRDLALEAGYTDQAHMTREFQTLGGITPKSPIKIPGIVARVTAH